MEFVCHADLGCYPEITNFQHTYDKKYDEDVPMPAYAYHPSVVPPVKFTLEFLNRITNNFSEERIIDRGRYGAIYKVNMIASCICNSV